MKLQTKNGQIVAQFKTQAEMYRHLAQRGDSFLRKATVVCGAVKYRAIDWQQRAYGQVDMRKRIAAR